MSGVSEMNRGIYLLVCDLSNKYGFDKDDALTYMGISGYVNKETTEIPRKEIAEVPREETAEVPRKEIAEVPPKKIAEVPEKKKKSSDGTTNKKHGRKKTIPLPWLGHVNENCCRALIYNNGLYTQCNNVSEEYCQACIDKKESNNGSFDCGTVEDRLKKDFSGMNGKGVKPYGNILKLKKISREEVLVYAKEQGIEIPEQLFQVETRGRGRPKKVSTAVDDTPPKQTEKKKRGRPAKRSVEVVEETNGEDLIKTLIQKATEKPVEVKKEEEDKETVVIEKVTEQKEVELQEEEEEEEEEQQEVTVEEFIHEGIKYYKSDTGILYNMDSEEVGIWNEERQLIEEITE